MADDMDDRSQKTEEPTERKLEEARKKGNVAVSKEVGIVMSTLGMLIIIAFMAPDVLSNLAAALLPLIENPASVTEIGSPTDLRRATGAIILAVAVALAPVFILLLLMALLSARLQGDFVVSTDRITPKLQNISPMKGLTRIYSMSGLVEFLKSIAKVLVVAAAGWIVISTEASRWIEAVHVTPDAIPRLAGEALVKLLVYVLVALVAITVLDFLWKRFDHRRKLRMSRREMKEEFKQTEGDPMIKAKLAEIRRSRARRRMMSAVPAATVVLANPTHYAVALRYNQGEDEAPVCVAKGVDAVALKIREVAEEAEVPVVEDPPLARALHASSEIDEAIPYEHFRAVAEIISYVYRQQDRAR